MEDTSTPAEKLAALNERLKGTAVLALLNIKSKPAPEALVQRVNELRQVILGLCQHLPEKDPVRAIAVERLKSVELLLQDPLEWHILTRAAELQQDASDPNVRALIESAFYEEHVLRTVWLATPPEGSHAELRKSMRLPLLATVDLDVAGTPTRCHTQNLSRDGVCLDVPAGFSGTAVTMVLHLAATGAQLPAAGTIVWRDGVRVGISFKIGVNEQNLLDAALQQHFAGLARVVDRWRVVAPKSGAAVACAAIVGYASSALPSTRREHLERLATAAQADLKNKELELALAKLRIEEGDLDGATTALKFVVVADRADPRYRVLQKTLEQRRGGGRSKIRVQLEKLGASARTAVLGALIIVSVGAAVTAVVAMQSPFVVVNAPPGGLACDHMKILQTNAMCFVDAVTYGHLPAKDRARLAESTLQSLRSRGIAQITVAGLTNEGILDTFDELSLTYQRKP